jgi:hypothetical protein
MPSPIDTLKANLQITSVKINKARAAGLVPNVNDVKTYQDLQKKIGAIGTNPTLATAAVHAVEGEGNEEAELTSNCCRARLSPLTPEPIADETGLKLGICSKCKEWAEFNSGEEDEAAEQISVHSISNSTMSESTNITNFLKAISQKNYAQADKYLQATVDSKIKVSISNAIKNSK